MTNGEMIKKIFGVKDEQINEGVMFVTIDGFDCPKDNLCGGHDFFKNWWNAEYKEPRKALEQEPILDKIRAEIERGKIGLDIEFNGGIDYALSIIDKYKTESEE